MRPTARRLPPQAASPSSSEAEIQTSLHTRSLPFFTAYHNRTLDSINSLLYPAKSSNYGLISTFFLKEFHTVRIQKESKKTARFLNEIGLRHLVGGGGFEPPKSLTTDLQSAPFGHSGNLPYPIVCRRWSWWTDSNPRPADYKSAALPTELHQLIGFVSAVLSQRRY